jgi:phosphoribosylamine--glycine ligase
VRILAISSDGFGSAIALNLQREGNEVHYFIKDPKARNIYKGILDNETDWKPHLSWADYVAFLNNGLSDIWEIAHKSKPCFCGSTAGEELEKNRSKAHKLMSGLGMKEPESLTFKDIGELTEHVKSHKACHVVKPIGKDLDSDAVFISEYKDGRDVIALLHRMEDKGQKFDYIECEEKIDGVEAGVGGYFAGGKFAPGIIVNFQHKRYAAGNSGEGVGFLTGEMGTIQKSVDLDNPFFVRTLAKMTDYLTKIDYRGEVDAGFIVNEEGDWFIEHTTRKGIPACVIQLEAQITPESSLYWQVANGNITENKFSKAWTCGVVMVSPGFPDSESAADRSVGLSIFGAEGNEKHCHLFEARKAERGFEVSAGGYGYPLVVTGKGATLESAIRNTYWQLHPANEKRVFVPKAWYRSDIGQRVMEHHDEIIELGILSEEEWEAS